MLSGIAVRIPLATNDFEICSNDPSKQGVSDAKSPDEPNLLPGIPAEGAELLSGQADGVDQVIELLVLERG